MTRTSRPRRQTRPAESLILPSKLARPNLTASVLKRARLIEALASHADRPLTLVVSDAGFGKSTLLAHYCAGLRRPIVWYALMPSDADPMVFGGHLLAGFRQQHPRFGRAFARALQDARGGGAAVSRLGVLFAHELESLSGPPTLLVLDDFHEVAGDKAVLAFMDTLVRHLPPGLRVLISARTAPPLGLERMRMRGELFELDSTHLRLTRDELRELFAEVYRQPLDEPGLEALEGVTLGWPTAVHLVQESLRRAPERTLDAVLAEFRGSNLELHDYLSSEVFHRLAFDERRVLERVAAMDRFDVALAAALAGGREAQAVLQRLTHRGLLRTFGAPEGAAYETHDLVRRFVRRRIEAEGGPAAWSALEADTARALAERGEPERALRHFLLAGRADDAIALVLELGGALLRQGRAATLLQYLLDLPADRVKQDPVLLVTLADCRQLLGHWDEAEALYREVLPLGKEAGLVAIECRAMLGLSKVLNMRGEHEQVLALAERGLAMSAGLDADTRVRLLQRKAGAHFYLGQYQAAERILGEARAALPPHAEPDLVLPTIHNLAMAYAAQGRFHEASREFAAALSQVRGGASPRAPLYLSNQAFLLSELGDLSEARAAAEEGLAAARRFSSRPQEITCHEALAQILAQGGDLDGALHELRLAEDLNREQRMEVIAGDLLALRGRIFCARGQYRRAVDFLNQAIERLGDRPDQPRLTDYRATLAWCELRAGRPRVARDILLALVPRADVEENEFQRMRVHYWLAEARLALGETTAVAQDMKTALERVRARGYGYFLACQAREEPAPQLWALARGLDVDGITASLVEAGPAIEPALLGLLDKATPAVGEAVVALLGEVGGSRSLERLPALARARRSLAPAARVAIKHLEARASRVATADKAESGGRPRLLLFGPPRLEIEGRQLPASAWRSQRALQILIYLALHPRGVPREKLLEAFWPGRQLAAGKRNFHPTLSYVRSVLPRAASAPLRREGEAYRLDPDYPLACDVWDFERALEEARNAGDAPARRAALERAIEIGGHPFLEGLYADWADDLQARHRDRLAQVLVQCADLANAAADAEGALRHYRRAAELDPYQESTRVSVIECLVRIGNRRAAIAETDRLRRMLRDELGVDVLPETEARIVRALGTSPQPGDEETDDLLAVQRVPARSQALLKGRVGV